MGVLTVLLVAAASSAGGAAAPGLARPPAFVPADDGQWTMAPKDYAALRYSALDEITVENVKDLRLAWSFSTGVLRGHEAAPLVVNGVMYVVTPWPNILYAFDLAKSPPT